MLIYFYIFLLNAVVYIQATEKFGGRYAAEGEFPYVVFIQGEIMCAGGLLSMARAVTAAHCFKIKKKGKLVDVNLQGAIVSAGSTVWSSEKNAQRKVKKILVATGFKSNARLDGELDNHNVGIVVLNEAFKPTKNLRAMKIVSKKKEKFRNGWDAFIAKRLVCLIVGWNPSLVKINHTDEDVCGVSDILKVFEVRVITNKECGALFKPKQDLTRFGEICVDTLRKDDLICNGDPGSPLICDGIPYGVLSFSPDCEGVYFPQIYILFENYLDFLDFNYASHLLIRKGLIFSLCFLVLKKYIYFS